MWLQMRTSIFCSVFSADAADKVDGVCSGGGRATPAELQDKGLKELKQDVAFCMSHQCRPLKVAEHASTAADFFFQLQSFDAAEEMLDVGVQVIRLPVTNLLGHCFSSLLTDP